LWYEDKDRGLKVQEQGQGLVNWSSTFLEDTNWICCRSTQPYTTFRSLLNVTERYCLLLATELLVYYSTILSSTVTNSGGLRDKKRVPTALQRCE